MQEDYRGKIVRGGIGKEIFWAIVKDGKVKEVELHNEWGQMIKNSEEEEYVKQSLNERRL